MTCPSASALSMPSRTARSFLDDVLDERLFRPSAPVLKKLVMAIVEGPFQAPWVTWMIRLCSVILTTEIWPAKPLVQKL